MNNDNDFAFAGVASLLIIVHILEDDSLCNLTVKQKIQKIEKV